MLNDPFFLLGLALLLVHEMDAIRCKEWRMFPITARMDAETGYLVFAALHVPLYALIFWGLFGDGGANKRLIFSLDAFFIVHVFLHLIYIKHPEHRFGSGFSWALILGAGACGALDLAIFLYNGSG